MSKVEAIIFDCDGVIFESRDANLAYYNKILSKFSHPTVSKDDHEQAHLCHTACSTDVLKGLLPEDVVAPALEYASNLDYRQFIPYMIPEPHLDAVLCELVGKYTLAIATNRGKSIEPILDHFDLREYFSVVVTSHDVERPKPAPDMLLLASQRLKVDVDKCLFIGDSDLDKRAASQAAVPFLGFGSAVSADTCLSSHSELIPYLTGLR